MQILLSKHSMRKLNINYRQTRLSDQGSVFHVEKFWHPKIDDWNPLYRDILEPFDFHKFTTARPPIDMGLIPDNPFNKCPSVLRMPIKWGNSDEIRLPKELKPIKEELIRILQYDKWINPNFTKFFAHITIDNSSVEYNKTQRFPGFHGDGLQGGKFKVKQICEHSYIYVNRNPTIVAMQPFFVAHINDSRFNIFKEFDRQIKKNCLYTTRPEHLYLIDPYIVHASPPNMDPRQLQRTFFRLTLTPSELLMPKNTVNPMFDGQIYPARIDVREFVSDPDTSIPLDYYGFEKEYKQKEKQWNPPF